MDAGNGVVVSRTPEHQILRLALPSPKITGTGGRWHVRLGIDRRGLTKVINRLKKLEDTTTIELILQHGVPATVTVQAPSNVHLDVATSQTSRTPGSTAHLRATLTDFGIPLASSAAVTAAVRRPDGATGTITLTETDPATYQADIDAPIAGVYRVLITAAGTTLHGEPSTREELRPIAVWNGGDAPPGPPMTNTPLATFVSS